MMYGKALLFRDRATAAAILTSTTPGAQKKLGRQVRGFDERVWDREKERIVEEGNWCKFVFPVEEEEDGGAGLRERLVATRGRELVEVSWWVSFLGGGAG